MNHSKELDKLAVEVFHRSSLKTVNRFELAVFVHSVEVIPKHSYGAIAVRLILSAPQSPHSLALTPFNLYDSDDRLPYEDNCILAAMKYAANWYRDHNLGLSEIPNRIVPSFCHAYKNGFLVVWRFP